MNGLNNHNAKYGKNYRIGTFATNQLVPRTFLVLDISLPGLFVTSTICPLDNLPLRCFTTHNGPHTPAVLNTRN